MCEPSVVCKTKNAPRFLVATLSTFFRLLIFIVARTAVLFSSEKKKRERERERERERGGWEGGRGKNPM